MGTTGHTQCPRESWQGKRRACVSSSAPAGQSSHPAEPAALVEGCGSDSGFDPPCFPSGTGGALPHFSTATGGQEGGQDDISERPWRGGTAATAVSREGELMARLFQEQNKHAVRQGTGIWKAAV